jgi:RNA polymerase sigma-70 factor (ECF subfamily)
VTDEQLMLDVKRGSHEAFQHVFERYRDLVWRFFRRRVDNPALAEELAQDTFVAILEAAPRYQPKAPFRSFAFGVAYNVLLASRRKESYRSTEPLASDAVAADEGDPEIVLMVRAALAELEGEDREILMLREYEQFSYEEIATLRQVPVSTIRSRLFRARMALRDILERPAAPAAKVAHGG